MSLRLKANLIFLLAAAVVLLPAMLLLDRAGDRAAVAGASHEATLLAAAAGVAGDYTRDRVAPLLAGPGHDAQMVFLPPSAPFYAVETQARMIAARVSDHTVRLVVLDPVGAADRPDGWERSAIDRLRAATDPAPFTAVRTDAAGVRHAVLVTPVRFSPGICATCYTSRAAAPLGILDAYGRDAGFDRKPGEIVGITVASVPVADAATGLASFAIGTLLASVALLWGALNLVLEFLVLRPLGRVAAVAEQVSLGRTGVQEFDTVGDDELGVITRAFNRLRRSMESAIGLLDT